MIKKYYVILDKLQRVKAIIHTDNTKSWLKYDDGNVDKIKTFIKKDRVLKFLDSKNINANSNFFDSYLN